VIQALAQATLMIGSTRTTRIVVVAGGNVYGGDASGVPGLLAGGSALFTPTQRIQAAASSRRIYLFDGNAPIQAVDPETLAMAAYTASAGTAPESIEFGVIWRDRLVVAGSETGEQNFFASRSGEHTDWDYGASDAAAAYAGNASLAGRIGDTITALMPFGDDVLVIGGDHTIWKMDGDLSDGGSLNMVTNSIGVLGPNAWCQDATGNMYFVSTAGFMRMQVDGSMQNLSADRVGQYFSAINRTNTYVECQWDQDRHGVWVFITPHSSTATVHLFWSARVDGWELHSFPNRFGPVTSMVYDGPTGDDRQIWMGGRDGYIQILDPDALNDDGEAISSYVYLGPLRPSGDTENAKLKTLDIALGERATGDTTTELNLHYTVQAGSAEREALLAPDRTESGQLTAWGEHGRKNHPLAGRTFWLKLWNATLNKTWIMDRIVGRFVPAGRAR
jgi:hypothetical protein